MTPENRATKRFISRTVLVGALGAGGLGTIMGCDPTPHCHNVTGAAGTNYGHCWDSLPSSTPPSNPANANTAHSSKASTHKKLTLQQSLEQHGHYDRVLPGDPTSADGIGSCHGAPTFTSDGTYPGDPNAPGWDVVIGGKTFKNSTDLATLKNDLPCAAALGQESGTPERITTLTVWHDGEYGQPVSAQRAAIGAGSLAVMPDLARLSAVLPQLV